MVLYGITLISLAKELRAADLGLLSGLYVDDAEFDRLAQRSSQLLKMLMERGPDQGYSPEPAKSLFILHTPDQEEVARTGFAVEGIVLNFIRGSQYLEACLGPQEELVVWVKPQVEAWAHMVTVLGKIA